MDQQEREAFWRGHVDAFLRQRGMQRDYCRQHGVSARELRKWRTRFYGPVRQPCDAAADLSRPQPQLREFSYAVLDRAKGPTVSGEMVGMPVVRRRWSEDDKRRLVWEGLNSGQSLARFAKRQGIHASVMHRWLRQFAQPVLTAASPDLDLPAFATVHIADPSTVTSDRQPIPAPDPSPAGARDGRLIEIELAGGRRVRVGAGVDPAALRRVIVVLESLA